MLQWVLLHIQTRRNSCSLKWHQVRQYLHFVWITRPWPEQNRHKLTRISKSYYQQWNLLWSGHPILSFSSDFQNRQAGIEFFFLVLLSFLFLLRFSHYPQLHFHCLTCPSYPFTLYPYYNISHRGLVFIIITSESLPFFATLS